MSWGCCSGTGLKAGPLSHGHLIVCLQPCVSLCAAVQSCSLWGCCVVVRLCQSSHTLPRHTRHRVHRCTMLPMLTHTALLPSLPQLWELSKLSSALASWDWWSSSWVFFPLLEWSFVKSLFVWGILTVDLIWPLPLISVFVTLLFCLALMCCLQSTVTQEHTPAGVGVVGFSWLLWAPLSFQKHPFYLPLSCPLCPLICAVFCPTYFSPLYSLYGSCHIQWAEEKWFP